MSNSANQTGRIFRVPKNPGATGLLGFPVQGVFLTEPAVLFKFQLIRLGTLVLSRRVISSLTFIASERDINFHR